MILRLKIDDIDPGFGAGPHPQGNSTHRRLEEHRGFGTLEISNFTPDTGSHSDQSSMTSFVQEKFRARVKSRLATLLRGQTEQREQNALSFVNGCHAQA